MNIRIEPKTLFVIISDMNGGVFPYNPCRNALTPTPLPKTPYCSLTNDATFCGNDESVYRAVIV